jgi:hypothetical protein
MRLLVLILGVCSLWQPALARVEIKDNSQYRELPSHQKAQKPRTGKKAAVKYFKGKGKKPGPAKKQRWLAGTDAAHYLGLHLGHFIDSDAYAWGEEDRTNGAGKLTIGVTYRLGEWINSMDLLFRGDFNSYSLKEDKAIKFSLLPMVTFPDARSKFPLYFGGGLGVGIFFKQLSEESSLSFDYQLVAGARFFDVFQTTGFTLEFGMKNHVHLLSDGQFNGVYVAVGTVFTF